MNKMLLLSLGLLAALPAHAQNSSHLVTAAATSAPARLAATTTDLPLTLEHAWQLAEQANPTLKSALANLATAEGQLADTQGLLWNNPQITAERVRRTVPDPGLNERTQREWGMGVTQTLEIAGQQGYRRTAAEQELAALRETIEEARRQLRAEVEQKFIRVVALQLRAEMETGLVDLIKENSTHVILEAAREVINPIAFAILIIIVVFLPLFSLTGLEGKMFKPMALTIAFAMVGSLVLTLTLVPVLSALILKPKEEKDTFLVRWAKQLYLPLLDRALENKKKVLGGAVALLVAALAVFPFLGKEFMPSLQEGSIMFRVTGIPSTSLEESIDVSKRFDALLKQNFPQVKSTLTMIGRAEKGETADVNYMEILIEVKPENEWPKRVSMPVLSAEMQEFMEKAIPTVVLNATQPIQMRIEELISGVRATLALKIYGEDLTTLDRLASESKAVLDKVPGVADLALEANKGKPQLVVKVNRDEAARYGINADEILEVVQAGIGGKTVSTVIDGVKRFDLQVRLDAAFRDSPQAISNIPIRTQSGALVPLSRVATVETDEGYSFVRREQLQRYAVLQLDVKGRDVDGFVKDADAKIRSQVKLPEGYWIEWGGAFENQQRAMARLAVIVPLTIGLIFILLYTAFNSLAHATLIIANVPFAVIGGVFGLAITGQYVSVPSAIGFIAVFGVAMLNGIVLVSFLNDRRRQGFSIREAVREGAALRLRPVLMTASVAILGLVPMLLSQGVGAETQRPLATVVVGGLFTSTVLTLLLLPLMYEWLETRRERKSSSV